MSTILLASAYHGPPPLTWTQVVTSWVFHPVPVALIVALGGWYAWRVHTLRRAGGTWPRMRTVWFVLGLAAYAIGTCSAIGVYHPVLFSMRAIQVVILLMVAPQFWAQGMPGTLARDTATPAGRRIASRILHARATRAVTHPLVGVVVLVGLPIGLYASAWYTASLTSHIVDELTQLALLAGGFHYFWTRLQRDPVPKLYPQYVTTWLTFADCIFAIIVPVALIVSPNIDGAAYYLAVARDWGPSLDADQNLGASALWGLGIFATLPFLLLSLKQMMRRDEAAAAVIDALEAEQHQQRKAASQTTTDNAGDDQAGDEEGGAAESLPPGHTGLWWENDPDLAEHFHWRR